MKAGRYVREKFGPDRWAEYILDPVWSTWDLWAFIVGALIIAGPRPDWWVWLVLAIWGAGRFWAARRRNG